MPVCKCKDVLLYLVVAIPTSLFNVAPKTLYYVLHGNKVDLGSISRNKGDLVDKF